MIVESAFLKIPEILLSHEEPDSLYEAKITNLLTNGPLMKIHMKKRYDARVNTRCDIYLDFTNFINDSIYTGYGVKAKK